MDFDDSDEDELQAYLQKLSTKTKKKSNTGERVFRGNQQRSILDRAADVTGKFGSSALQRRISVSPVSTGSAASDSVSEFASESSESSESVSDLPHQLKLDSSKSNSATSNTSTDSSESDHGPVPRTPFKNVILHGLGDSDDDVRNYLRSVEPEVKATLDRDSTSSESSVDSENITTAAQLLGNFGANLMTFGDLEAIEESIADESIESQSGEDPPPFVRVKDVSKRVPPEPAEDSPVATEVISDSDVVGTDIGTEERDDQYSENYEESVASSRQSPSITSSVDSAATGSKHATQSRSPMSHVDSYSEDFESVISHGTSESPQKSPKLSRHSSDLSGSKLPDPSHGRDRSAGAPKLNAQQNPFPILEPGLLRPTPLIPQVVPLESLKGLGSYNPVDLALHDLIRSQVELTRKMIQLQQFQAQEVGNRPRRTKRTGYTTLADTRAYIQRERPKRLTMEEAMKMVERDEHGDVLI